MNVKEYQKILNYQLLSNYCVNNRLLDNYYYKKPNLYSYCVYIDSYYVEHNTITCYYSINNDYYIITINNRIKLYNGNVKLYDKEIPSKLKKTNTLIYLLNRYLKGVSNEKE